MDKKAIMQIFIDTGAMMTNSHFVFTSGRHSSTYVNKDALYVHPKITMQLCSLMAKPFDADQVDVVAGPTVGGVILCQWVAFDLNQRRKCGETKAIYAEKEGEKADKTIVFERGYDLLVPHKNILVIEDVLMTGGSAAKVIEAVRKLGGNVLGLSVLCNRGAVKPKDVGNVPINALLDITTESWAEEDCPLCKTGVPVNVTVGKGKAFLERHGAAIEHASEIMHG